MREIKKHPERKGEVVRERKPEMGADMGKEKETREMWSRGRLPPPTVFRSMMMNYFDRDNHNEMLMRLC